MTSRLLFLGPEKYAGPWGAAFAELAPQVAFEVYQPGQDLSGYPYCLTWKPPHGLWPQMKELRVVFSLAAGVDRLLNDPSFPRHVPLVRMVEPELTRGMVEYVLWQCLFHHRRVWELEAAQSCGEWRPHTYPAPWDRTIGIMGLGELGAAAAAKLAEFGFKLRGWSRSPKSLAGVQCFAGRDQLPDGKQFDGRVGFAGRVGEAAIGGAEIDAEKAQGEITQLPARREPGWRSSAWD